MGSEQEVEQSSILVNTNLRSPHSSAATRLQAWTADDGGLFRYCLVFHGAGVWCRAWSGEGAVCQSIREGGSSMLNRHNYKQEGATSVTRTRCQR
jgi:hypothetical protein